jgi:hypothetical protein
MVKRSSAALIFILGLLIGCGLSYVASGRRNVLATVSEPAASSTTAAQASLLHAIAAVPEPLGSAIDGAKLVSLPGELEAAATVAEVNRSAAPEQIAAARDLARVLREDLRFEGKAQEFCFNAINQFAMTDRCRHLMDEQMRFTPLDVAAKPSSDRQLADAVYSAARGTVMAAKHRALATFRQS